MLRRDGISSDMPPDFEFSVRVLRAMSIAIRRLLYESSAA
jgi:hypothetical protein